MKINSIGINAYQEMTGRVQSGKKPAVIDKTEEKVKAGKIQIPGRINKVGSDISVKLGGSEYASMLSPEEKQALELLFEKFGDNKGMNITESTSRPGLGRFVDVKL